MADSDTDDEFGRMIDDAIANPVDFDDSGSDISVSSVDTEDLTDFEQSEDEDGDGNRLRSTGVTLAPAWSQEYSPLDIPEFDKYSGPPLPQKKVESPLDFFFLLIPRTYFYALAAETNLYARQCMQAKGVPEDQFNIKFEPTTAAEIRAYIGLMMFMNVSPLPAVRLYWAESLPTYNPWVASVMSRNRFQQLAGYFHLVDSTKAKRRGEPGYDPLYKVRPIISLTQETFAANYHPAKVITVDEAMIKFKGRCGFLQYLPAKATKWGLKVWACCDAKSFYMLGYSVYTGKINELPNTNEPLGDRVVKHLTAPFLNKWHTVYFDNYFTSVALLLNLFNGQTTSCGTVRNNRRGLPEEMKPAKCVKKSGDTLRWFKKMEEENNGVGQHKGNLQAIAWYDKRKVTVLSTAHTDADGEVVRLGRGGEERARYSRPLAIADYNRGYNGVDKHDQMRSYYGSTLKFRKWWKYVLMFCFDTAAVNAFLVYLKSPGRPRTPLTHLYFQLAIITGLVGDFKGRKRVGRPISRDQTDKHRHTPSKITTARGKRDCILCKQENRLTPTGHRIQSAYECSKCAVALCKDRGCFGKFHQD